MLRHRIGALELLDGAPHLYHFGDGRVVFEREESPRLQYKLTDHLGNTVVLFEDRNNNGVVEEISGQPEQSEVLQRQLYYPFGLALRGPMPQQPDPAQDYRYNGKERLPGSEIYAYGFRHYDPVVGRFLGVDPISDRFAWVSVYNYAENEPVGHIDLHGLQKWNLQDGNTASGPYRNQKSAAASLNQNEHSLARMLAPKPDGRIKASMGSVEFSADVGLGVSFNTTKVVIDEKSAAANGSYDGGDIITVNSVGLTGSLIPSAGISGQEGQIVINTQNGTDATQTFIDSDYSTYSIEKSVIGIGLVGISGKYTTIRSRGGQVEGNIKGLNVGFAPPMIPFDADQSLGTIGRSVQLQKVVKKSTRFIKIS